MGQAVYYINQEARPNDGDEIWILGDMLHLHEMGWETCLNKPVTGELMLLARRIPTVLIPGNHEIELRTYWEQHTRPNDPPDTRISHPKLGKIQLVKSLETNSFFFCHGDEADPVSQMINFVPAVWDRLTTQKTPGEIRIQGRQTDLTFLAVAQMVHAIALTDLIPKKQRELSRLFRGIVLGHTHLPLIEQSSELPYLLDCGDMRDSGTFIELDVENSG
jgi:UDP-2,3-diacylglucosamine pyrophosphatase LpxH